MVLIMTDVKIVEGLKKKSERAFDCAYNKYYKLVYYVIFNEIGDRAEATNLANDTFVDMFNRSESIDNNGLRDWLVIRARLKAKEYLNLNSSGDEDDLFLKLCSRILTKEEFNVLNYHAVFKMDFKEIGSILDMSESEAQRLYKRSMIKLKTEM